MPEQGLSAGDDRKSMADSVLTFDSSLLTPPRFVDNPERPPFKPLSSDNVSLSMKKSGKGSKQHRRLNRACASSGDVKDKKKMPAQTEHEHRLTRKSLPDLSKYRRPMIQAPLFDPSNYACLDQKLQQLSSEPGKGSSNMPSSNSRQISDVPQRPRRWTVPSKAQPTHLVCFTNHMRPATILDKSSDEPSTVTPAMIVLRRATIKKQRVPSTTQTNITFFPPPKFTRPSTTLLSFLRMASQQSQDVVNNGNTDELIACSPVRSLVPSPPRRPSVTRECAQPCCSVTAEPAITDVMVFSGRDHNATQNSAGPRHRRFSTKIVSQSSVHEIIWDENITSGESNSSSSNISRQPTTNKKRTTSTQTRKQSIAVEKLETQLRRDNSDSRRASPGSPSELHQTHQKSFQSLLNFRFGEARAKAGDLKDLPRSRASLSSTTSRVNDEILYNPSMKTREEDAGICDETEFFPPLRCRASPNSREQSVMIEQGCQPDGTAYLHWIASMGRGLGQSRHVRRKTAANCNHRVGRVRSLAGLNDEYMPLLSETGLDGTSGTIKQSSSISVYFGCGSGWVRCPS